MPVPCFFALLLPFLGTSIGSAFVFFLKSGLGKRLGQLLNGFAAGVMVAASVWSLILPAIEQSTHLGPLSFLPAVAGIWSGFLFLKLLDRTVPHLHQNSTAPEGPPSAMGRSSMLVFAVALHNLPEGMAVGVAVAGFLTGSPGISAAGVFSLAMGIALQNLPEGAIISMPLHSGGMKRAPAFGWGVISGAIEPVGAVATVLLAQFVVPVLPFLLSFSAGAMLYVVVEELIPEMSENSNCDIGTLAFAGGFTLMLALDVALG